MYDTAKVARDVWEKTRIVISAYVPFKARDVTCKQKRTRIISLVLIVWERIWEKNIREFGSHNYSYWCIASFTLLA